MSTSRRQSLHLSGRVLWLTEDGGRLEQQLAGQDLTEAVDADELMDAISTDEITPGWVCYYYDETLARYCLVGLRGGHVKRDDIKEGGFAVIVSGRSKGCGSSRETAPYSKRAANVRTVIARSIQKTYAPHHQTSCMLTTTQSDFIDRLTNGRG